MKHHNCLNSKRYSSVFILVVLFCVALSAQHIPVNKSSYKDIFMWYPNPTDSNTKDINIHCKYNSEKNVLKVYFKNISKDTLIVVNSNFTSHPSILRVNVIDLVGDTIYYLSYNYSDSSNPSIIAPKKSFEFECHLKYFGINFSKVYKINLKHLIKYMMLPTFNKKKIQEPYGCHYIKEEDIIVNKKHE